MRRPHRWPWPPWGSSAALALALWATAAQGAASPAARGSPASPAVPVTAAGAEAIARATPEVKALLERYGRCDGCRIKEPPASPPRIGCVSYEVRMTKTPLGKSAAPARPHPLGTTPPTAFAVAFSVEYWVGKACPFRYLPSEGRVSILVRRDSGEILARSPKLEVIRDVKYCDSSADCVCLSGSGRPFIGCANRFHGVTHFAGHRDCGACPCVEHVCGGHRRTGPLPSR